MPRMNQCVSALLAKLLVDSPVSSPRWQLEDETDPKRFQVRIEIGCGQKNVRPSMSRDCHTGSWLPTYSTIGKEGGVPGGAIAQLLILQQIYYNLAVSYRFECLKIASHQLKFSFLHHLPFMIKI